MHKYFSKSYKNLIFQIIIFQILTTNFILFLNCQNVTDNEFGCHCMEYWTCITSGGQVYSYCGLSASSVCCFVALNAKPVGILPVSNEVETCGKKGADTSKDGQAEMSEWPWHVALLEGNEDLYLCGASLLDNWWVLTAAHCVDEYVPYDPASGSLKVRLGEYDVSTTAEPLRHEELKVQRVVLHPQFDNVTLVNDIALLLTERSVHMKQNIEAVCMPKVDDFVPGLPNSCYITGWGKKDEQSEHSVVLKEIKVPLWDHQKCQDALKLQFGSTYNLPSTAICAGSEGNDACDGDGGGPLVCEKEGHWYQVGVISFGIGCGRKNTPGVYTRVDAYSDWIKEVTKSKRKHAHTHA